MRQPRLSARQEVLPREAAGDACRRLPCCILPAHCLALRRRERDGAPQSRCRGNGAGGVIGGSTFPFVKARAYLSRRRRRLQRPPLAASGAAAIVGDLSAALS